MHFAEQNAHGKGGVGGHEGIWHLTSEARGDGGVRMEDDEQPDDLYDCQICGKKCAGVGVECGGKDEYCKDCNEFTHFEKMVLLKLNSIYLGIEKLSW